MSAQLGRGGAPTGPDPAARRRPAGRYSAAALLVRGITGRPWPRSWRAHDLAPSLADPGPAGGAAERPLAHSPIEPAPPVAVVDGWVVSARRATGALRLVDCTPLAKVLVRARPGGAVATLLGVGHGRAARDANGTLVVGSGPTEWLLLTRPGDGDAAAARVQAAADGDADLVTIVPLVSHGRALMRLTGAAAPGLLAKVCAIDFGDRATPDGSAFRSSVARLATDVVRDDLDGERSYLLHCERSSGRYLWDSLLDAGAEFGVEPDGFTTANSLGNGHSKRRAPQ